MGELHHQGSWGTSEAKENSAWEVSLSHSWKVALLWVGEAWLAESAPDLWGSRDAPGIQAGLTHCQGYKPGISGEQLEEPLPLDKLE